MRLPCTTTVSRRGALVACRASGGTQFRRRGDVLGVADRRTGRRHQAVGRYDPALVGRVGYCSAQYREVISTAPPRPAPPRRAPPSHMLQLSSGTGLRGWASATCLAEADTAGRDYWLPTLAASIWTVTCPHHGERLFDLRSFDWRLDRGRLRLSHGVEHGVGARSRSSQYASKLLRVCEAAFIRALLGQSVGSVWRTRKPHELLACVEALAAPVFWRAGAGGPSLARYFDEVAGCGRLSFYVNEDAQ